MSWRLEPLHTALTKMEDGTARKAAVGVHRNILGYMGDRALLYPGQLGREARFTVVSFRVPAPGRAHSRARRRRRRRA